MDIIIAKERLFQTADRERLVPEGHQDGAFLYVAPGDQIPESAAKKYGLVDGKLSARVIKQLADDKAEAEKKAAEEAAAKQAAAQAEAEQKAAEEAAAKEAEARAQAEKEAADEAAAKEAAAAKDKEAKAGQNKTKGD